MLTFMKKDHNFDGEDTQFGKPESASANGKENAPEKMKFMGLSDFIALLVIALLVGGGYYYFKYAKENAQNAFARCEALYTSADLLAAEACYDSTWDLGYVTDSMEVIRQNRSSEIADKRIIQMDLLESAENYIKSGELLLAKEEMQKLEGQNLLLGKYLEAWNRAKSSVSKLPTEALDLQDSSLQQ